MRLAAMFGLSSGALIGPACGPFSTGEGTLWRELWDKLEPGDIMLADCGYCGYADFGLLLGQGVDSVMRLHGRRSTGVREIEKLGNGDCLVEWLKGQKPRLDQQGGLAADA